MKQKEKILYLVIPCYNEEEILPETTKGLTKKIHQLIEKNKISPKSKILYVNDGSKDNTWKWIKEKSKEEPLITGISLSKNKGQQNALLAGLLTAKEYADIVISMDADLQDDVDIMEEMIEKYSSGIEIVYGVRKSRKKDTWFKKTTAQLFYQIMNLLGVEIINNHADYRLVSKKVLKELEKYKEVNLFLRGIFPMMGFQSDIIYYDRKTRSAGKSKYGLKKMLNLAWDGITSFSIKPIRLVLTLGIIIFLLSIMMISYSIIQKINGQTVSGWTFTVCSIWLIAGIEMLSLGIIGEYIGKIYNETKQRPRYMINENLMDKEKKKSE